MSRPSLAYISAFATILLWASAFPLIRIALQSFEPIPLAALRFAIAAAIWLVWVIWKKPKLPSAKDSLRLLICASIGIAFYNVLLNTGQKTVSAGAASFIVNTVPVITALLSVVFLGEKFRAWAWIGTAISFAGVALIASDQHGGFSFGAGAALVVGAALCQAIFFTLQKPLIGAYGPKVCAASVIILGALCLSPWLGLAIQQVKSAPITGLLAVVYLGIFPAAIGYATWGIAQSFFGASRAANFLYLVPPAAVCIAFMLTDEVPIITTLIGGAAAICGVIVVNTRGKAQL
jgi:drug/metabolite transporter (DMT)-like permease